MLNSSALVKLTNNFGMLGISSAERDLIANSKTDKMHLTAAAGSVLSLRDNTEITDWVIDANQTVIIRPAARICPPLYHLLVSWNPELTLRGALVSPIVPMVPPKSNPELIGLLIRTSKKLTLEDIKSDLFSFYLID